MKFCLLSDLPPIENGGVASHSISWNICQALKSRDGVLVTRRYHRSIDSDDILQKSGIPTFMYPDASHVGLRQVSESLRFGLDALGLRFSIGEIRNFLVRHNIDRLFALPFNHWAFLPAALQLKRATGLPMDLYLVDDLEASSEMQSAKLRAFFTRNLEGVFLEKYDRVFVISEGFSEHLFKKYGISALVLPPLVRTTPRGYRVFVPGSEGVYWLAFSGSANRLYIDTLQILINAISKINKKGGRKFGIRFFVAKGKDFQKMFRTFDVPFDVREGCSNIELIDGLSKSYACLLPYSFLPEMKIMVSTAFSCKIAEYLVCGRPIVSFGPAYSSIPRHFLKHSLPLTETFPEKAPALLDSIANFDSPQLIASYERLLAETHSPEVFFRTLQIS